RMPESPETVQSELDYILDEVDGMTRLVDDLLLLARVDDSSLLLEREERDLVEIAASVLDPMRAVATARNLELRYPSTAEPIVAFVDAGRVRQVLRILIDNALRYTPSGGEITVSMERQADRVLIRVKDTGIGIAPEEREKIFRRFYRAEADRSRNTGGTGLGLTIARALVVAHGGDIGVESELGHGSTFWFTLPAPS
ncbi:MAG: histidine kinase, partial [Thermomicrobiales bacterium]|nr:histidine kinase [Thermomicrobiales bacterium]